MGYQINVERYTKINYNRCGNSGLKLPPISLGLWHNFGDVDDFRTGENIILTAFDQGITHFDLANNYGPPPGSAEINFGKVLKQKLHAYRDEIIISTKAGYYMWPGPYGEWGSKKYLVASLDQSLKRMGLDYVDIFYSHRPDPETPFEETMAALDLIVRQGKALYIGLSNYTTEQTLEALELLDSFGTRCLIHQPKYSMLVRDPEKSLLDVLFRKGIGCIPFSPLAQGLLTNKYIKGIPKGSRADKSHGFLQRSAITPDLVEKLIKLDELARRRGQTLAQMALSWILKDRRITSVLIGASSIAQLKDNLACLNNLEFSHKEINEIDTILKQIS
jgi:L-glyceraldehyde 3-phosphate reductase